MSNSEHEPTGSPAPSPRPAEGHPRPWFNSALYWYATGLIVALGLSFGQAQLPKPPSTDHFPTPPPQDPIAACANWDGQWYVRIARDGYSYDREAMSSVAFYPAYPLCGRFVAWVTRLDYDLSLAIVSNVAFFFALLLLQASIRRSQNSVPGQAEFAALAMAVFPVSFFFRVAYSDSLFLMLAILTLYGLRRQWPILVVAALVGLTTAARPVGVALVPPVCWVIWNRKESLPGRLLILAVAGPLCVWGLAAYSGFLSARFGNPMAFAQTQEHWRFRRDADSTAKVNATLTLEPIGTVYEESDRAHWQRFDQRLGAEFSLQFANPIYFVGVCALVGFGAWRRWLSVEEVLFAAGALLIPYLTKSFDSCMSSHARYAAVAFPVYIVMGRLLAGFRPEQSATLCAVSAWLLGVYAALFAGYYLFI